MVNGRAHTGKTEACGQQAGRVKRWALLLATAAVLGFGSARSAQAADQFFDWLYEAPDATQVNYVPAPTLSDQTVAQVTQYLTQQQALHPTQPLAVKVRAGTTLSQSTINAIYGTYKIAYTFADYEGANADTQAKALVNQIRGSAVTGPLFQANQAFVGNYAIAPIPGDPTAPAGSTYTSGNSTSEPYFTSPQFANTGLNMVNEVLYPGDASFRNPVSGTNPNIRSALFTLPILRMANVQSNLGMVPQHIPYISRFNNSDNPTLQNSTFNGQGALDTTKAGSTINGLPVAGQLLSRDDFQALVLHYRMRGANGYHLLDPGVVGYTETQEQSDALAGWNLPAVAAVMNNPTSPGRAVPAASSVTLDGAAVSTPSDQAGVIWSAVTNDSQVTGTPELAVLVSNLSAAAHTVTFATSINGKVLNYTTSSLAAGSHTLLRFTRTAGSVFWTALDSSDVFNDPTLASRDGVGIPEPASLSLLGLGAMGVLMRRSRRKA